MDLDEQDIQEFREIWEHEFSEKLSLDAARHEAHLLLELYSALASPLPDEEQSDHTPT